MELPSCPGAISGPFDRLAGQGLRTCQGIGSLPSAGAGVEAVASQSVGYCWRSDNCDFLRLSARLSAGQSRLQRYGPGRHYGCDRAGFSRTGAGFPSGGFTGRDLGLTAGLAASGRNDLRG